MAVSTTEQGEDLARGLTPWVTISTMPRATMRAIVTSDPRRHVLLIAVLAGLAWQVPRHIASDAMASAAVRLAVSFFPIANPADFATAIAAVQIVGGAVGSVFALYVNGWTFRVVGAWLGGRATSVEVRAAFAWSSVPLVFLALPASLAAYLTFGAEALSSGTPGVALRVFLGFVRLWMMGLMLVCLAEVHRVSVARALAMFLVLALLIGVVVGVPLGVILALRLH